MYLSKLQLRGFKSFAKKTEIIFKDGITCIVGPNGSGKTNIVDAIRWVLGEQRAGVLRSDKMEKVIFAGSKSQKPLGMAEVSMTIQNDRSVLPSEYTEVMLTRRLYRSGESEYLLNKKPCRLKDINDLFLDTGMGPDTYSVIELKMVESILSPRTEERLRLFEEAAGISKYKQRRAAALRKLDAAQDDLNRVNDILSEVDRTVNSLKRQVHKAERYKHLSQEIEGLDIRHASLEFGRILRELEPLKSRLEQDQEAFQSNRTMLSKEEAFLERMRAEILSLEDHLSRVLSRWDAVTQDVHQKENELAVSKERIRSLKEKINRYKTEKEQIQKRRQILTRRLEEGQPKLVEMQEITDGYRLKFRFKQEELKGFEKILNRRRLEANDYRMKLVELLKELDRNEKERSRHESQILHLQGKQEQLQKELESAGEEANRLKDSLAERKKRDSSAGDKREKLSQEFLKTEKAVRKAETIVQALREQLPELKSGIEGKYQQRNFLQHVIEINEGFPKGVKFLLEHQRQFPGLLGPLGDLIAVPARYRNAVEAVLSEMVSFLVVEKAEHAYAAIERLKQEKLGQVTFVVLEWLKDIPEGNRPSVEETGVIGWASDLINVNARFKSIVSMWLGDYLIVEDSAVQKSIYQKHGLNVVTLAGELISRRGFLRTAWYTSGERVAGIGRKNQLDQLMKEIQAFEKDQRDVSAKLEEKQKFLESLKKVLETQREALKQYDEENFRNQVKLARDQETYRKLLNQTKAIKSEIAATDASVQEAYKKIDALMPAIKRLSRRREMFEKELETLLEKLEGLEEERNRLAEEVHELNLNLVRATGEKKNIASEIERMKRTTAELVKTLETRDQEISEAEADIERLEGMIEEAHTALAELYSRRELLAGDKNRIQQELETLREKLQSKERGVKSAREAGESSSDVLRNLKLKISELELRADNIKHNIQEKYAVEIVPAQQKSPEEPREISERLEMLRKRLQSYGPVNLLSLEEYEKESNRLEFLEKQRADLLEAKNTLLETISVINKTAHDKFYRVFQEIRENFGKNFKSFFDGGEGDIRIKFDPEDPLEADISIMARAKGKAITSMDLLSAGEKALTAITLLFSIYQVKPSPFCVLDEVDAPLDDVSLRRFLKVVRNFSETIQFILVTHNKVTMEASDNIYGVTMTDEGVSRLISVRFEKEKSETAIEVN
ncbi:chromosome partition protein Smc [bacterium BMS3Abin05]|nr:chromosome partition protein Smc [bacterium BMS3Abin05]GBE27817.1 chromosome partition protein Smc [bacterium BMS3Bbin03]